MIGICAIVFSGAKEERTKNVPSENRTVEAFALLNERIVQYNKNFAPYRVPETEGRRRFWSVFSADVLGAFVDMFLGPFGSIFFGVADSIDTEKYDEGFKIQITGFSTSFEPMQPVTDTISGPSPEGLDTIGLELGSREFIEGSQFEAVKDTVGRCHDTFVYAIHNDNLSETVFFMENSQMRCYILDAIETECHYSPSDQELALLNQIDFDIDNMVNGINEDSVSETFENTAILMPEKTDELSVLKNI